jgi:RNA polymerase sigma-70 factor (ECF subfamily)
VIDPTVQQAQGGDRDAQAELLGQLQDPWFRMCCSLLGDAEKAREATQETALRFLKLLPRFRGESQLKTWSLGIAINVAREMRRSASNRAVGIDGTELGEMKLHVEPSPDETAEQAEQVSLLRASLKDLPERQREAIVLRFFEDLSVEETAAAMHCAAGTVKATVHQALRALKNKLGQKT